MVINLIEVSHLSKTFNSNTHVLKDINFTVQAGETLAIIGPSGSGKSTILKILAGLTDKTSGHIYLSNDNIGMAFQYSALLNSYNIYDNIALALHNNITITPKDKDALIRDILSKFKLSEFIDYLPNDLSGGQQKRASFARAIIHNPSIVFFDEPTAGLDPINSTILEDYIVKLTSEYDVASVVVTHQHSTIRRVADKIICLHKGHIVWAGTVKELDTDSNPYIRQFIDGQIDGPFNIG